MGKFFLLVLISVLLQHSVSAKAETTPVLNNFAFARTINSKQGDPLNSFEILEDIYRTVKSSSLNDLRIFSSVVPYQIAVETLRYDYQKPQF